MDALQTAAQWILAHVPDLIQVAALIVAAAAAIAALTPTPDDDSMVAKIKKVVDWLGLNFGHAKNAGPK